MHDASNDRDQSDPLVMGTSLVPGLPANHAWHDKFVRKSREHYSMKYYHKQRLS